MTTTAAALDRAADAALSELAAVRPTDDSIGAAIAAAALLASSRARRARDLRSRSRDPDRQALGSIASSARRGDLATAGAPAGLGTALVGPGSPSPRRTLMPATYLDSSAILV
jgi:hypothetical protein